MSDVHELVYRALRAAEATLKPRVATPLYDELTKALKVFGCDPTPARWTKLQALYARAIVRGEEPRMKDAWARICKAMAS